MANVSGLTKADLISEVVDAGVPRRDAAKAVQTVIDSIVESLQSGEGIELRGFSSFRIRQRAARVGRNPKTGDRVMVPAKRVPYFKPGKALRESVNRSQDPS